jgi:hypothetical protein
LYVRKRQRRYFIAVCSNVQRTLYLIDNIDVPPKPQDNCATIPVASDALRQQELAPLCVPREMDAAYHSQKIQKPQRMHGAWNVADLLYRTGHQMNTDDAERLT